jgi:hypothetical protein
MAQVKTNFQKLNEIILSSNIPFEERERFLLALSQLDDEFLGEVVDFFKDREWVTKMYDNFHKKEEAIKSGNRQDWDKIVEDEEDALKSIAQAESD